MFKSLADIERVAAVGRPARVIRQFVGSYLQGQALREQYAATLAENETPDEGEYQAWLAEQRQDMGWTPPEITDVAVEAWMAGHYAELRAGAYPPIGDQLDAILKGLNQLRLDGVALPNDTNAAINAALAVKAAFPKPEAS